MARGTSVWNDDGIGGLSITQNTASGGVAVVRANNGSRTRRGSQVHVDDGLVGVDGGDGGGGLFSGRRHDARVCVEDGSVC